MTAALEPTGERMIEESYGDTPGRHLIYLMHVASYRYASAIAAGKRVLDLGCGSGYGAALIAECADSVVAVDVARDSIEYAREHYARANLDFRTIDAGAPLPFAAGSFDLVLSFQVIEHVLDDVGYLKAAHTVLAPEGNLLLITPDRRHRLLAGMRPWNRWHVREYDDKTLGQRVAQVFDGEVDLRYMNLREDIAHLELDRYRMLKWLTLPFTLPWFPDAWRVAGLNLAHRFSAPPTRNTNPTEPFGFDESAISIDRVPARAVNLVVAARKLAPT